MIDYTLEQVREAVRETELGIEAMSCGRCLVSVAVLHHNKHAKLVTTDYSRYQGTGFCIVRVSPNDDYGNQEDLSPLLARLAMAFDREFYNGYLPTPVTKEQALAFIDEFEREEQHNG